jgi:hypothetical protein
MEIQDSGQEATQFPQLDRNKHAEILSQLRHIQNSHAFCNSVRSKEFLSYVVEQVLAGHTEDLKERSIGVNLFHRTPTYDTGEDPIVRVKAGEVRRRLAEYYAREKYPPELQIELPVGSYVPRFRWKPQTVPTTPADPVSLAPEVENSEAPAAPLKHPGNHKKRAIAVALTIAGIAAIGLWLAYYHNSSALDRFWQPLVASKQPILICVPTPVSYAASTELYRQSPAASSGIYDSVAKRNQTPLQLDPGTPIKWKEFTPLADFYVNKDDAYVVGELSVFFASEHRPTQIRFGEDYTYEDLRSSPTILIGAYNNPWIGRVMSDLPIGFGESDGILWIEDRTKPGQVWKASENGRLGSKDFALIARLPHSKTSQSLLILSGIGMVGTKAAGHFVIDPGDLETVLRGAPTGWEGKNLEIVLETDIVDGSPSPPRAVALKVW